MKGTDVSELLTTLWHADCLDACLIWEIGANKFTPPSACLGPYEAIVGAYCANGLQPLQETQCDHGRLRVGNCWCVGCCHLGGVGPLRLGTALFVLDPEEGFEVRRVQPYEALKTYLCPGCNRDLPPGLGHMVAIPVDSPDLRRHWHYGCWQARHRRRPRG